MQTYTIRISSSDSHADVQVRRLLKALLRAHNFRCEAISRDYPTIIAQVAASLADVTLRR